MYRLILRWVIKINENLLKQELIHRLKEQQAYHTSVNGVQHYVRCPYCGDSKNPNHGHFSIKIDLSSDVPMVYRCLKCSVSGLLTEDALYELDIPLNESMKKDLVMYTKRAAKKSNLVNLETDIIGKYVEKFLQPMGFRQPQSVITKEFLSRNGF